MNSLLPYDAAILKTVLDSYQYLATTLLNFICRFLFKVYIVKQQEVFVQYLIPYHYGRS